MKKPRSRWLQSRVMLIGGALCLMAYIPAVWGENALEWIKVFGGTSFVYLGIIGGKNVIDSYRNGPYRSPNEEESTTED